MGQLNDLADVTSRGLNEKLNWAIGKLGLFKKQTQ